MPVLSVSLFNVAASMLHAIKTLGPNLTVVQIFRRARLAHKTLL